MITSAVQGMPSGLFLPTVHLAIFLLNVTLKIAKTLGMCVLPNLSY